MMLKDIRKELGLTLEEAATRLGVHFSTWHKWEKGCVPPHRAIQIEAVFGISRARIRPDFFDRESACPSSPEQRGAA
ncbi:helix-turn-helix domain-containing protein [Komagataeibacter xylinus]|uniref:helix-turn-helix domain-containing protein n=1 Tax=Komagataeibacter xylinus TaxID=28448 RepID=UPI000FDF767C|nr:hypothetical protein CXP35_15380 [Komagataeibacter xylinus]